MTFDEFLIEYFEKYPNAEDPLNYLLAYII